MFSSATVFRMTELGSREIGGERPALGPRLRRALILVDGVKTPVKESFLSSEGERMRTFDVVIRKVRD